MDGGTLSAVCAPCLRARAEGTHPHRRSSSSREGVRRIRGEGMAPDSIDPVSSQTPEAIVPLGGGLFRPLRGLLQEKCFWRASPHLSTAQRGRGPACPHPSPGSACHQLPSPSGPSFPSFQCFCVSLDVSHGEFLPILPGLCESPSLTHTALSRRLLPSLAPAELRVQLSAKCQRSDVCLPSGTVGALSAGYLFQREPGWTSYRCSVGTQ